MFSIKYKKKNVFDPSVIIRDVAGGSITYYAPFSISMAATHTKLIIDYYFT